MFVTWDTVFENYHR